MGVRPEARRTAEDKDGKGVQQDTNAKRGADRSRRKDHCSRDEAHRSHIGRKVAGRTISPAPAGRSTGTVC